jgi:hypothetical protein
MRRAASECWWCGCEFTDANPPTVDHVVPKADGGRDAVSNLVPCCKACNGSRGCLSAWNWPIPHERQCIGIVLGALRNGDGIDAARAKIDARGFPIGEGRWRELLRRMSLSDQFGIPTHHRADLVLRVKDDDYTRYLASKPRRYNLMRPYRKKGGRGCWGC